MSIQVSSPAGPTGLGLTTSAGRGTSTGRSTCGNGTRTMSPASKIVVDAVELVRPFGKGRERIIEGIERGVGPPQHDSTFLDLPSDLVARADAQGAAHSPGNCRLRLAGDATVDHARNVRNFLTTINRRAQGGQVDI